MELSPFCAVPVCVYSKRVSFTALGLTMAVSVSCTVCSVVPLVYPDGVDAAFTASLREAAAAGGASFFTTGIDSGFANDVMPLVLTGVSRVIESVRVTEMFNYATYPDKDAVYEILGFGKPPEFSAFAAAPGMFTFGWGPVVHQLAAGLGVKIDNLDEIVERVVAEESFDTPTGHIAAGTVGAMRSTLTENPRPLPAGSNSWTTRQPCQSTAIP